MNIYRCNECGAILHEAGKCYHCGSKSFSQLKLPPKVHQNVLSAFIRMGVHLQSKQYAAVIDLADEVIQWTPNYAEVYWMRLLAKNNCSTDVELICTGVNCEKDADYKNAVAFASSEELCIYEDVKTAINTVYDRLSAAIAKDTYNRKKATHMIELNNELPRQIAGIQERLFERWQALQITEQELCSLQMDCRFATKEHQDAIVSAKLKANGILLDISKITECSDSKTHEFRVMLGTIIQQSDKACNVLNQMRTHHPWVKRFKELVEKRDKQVADIQTGLAGLKRSEQTIIDAIQEYEELTVRHQNLVRSLEEKDYLVIRTTLGDRIFARVLQESGIVL